MLIFLIMSHLSFRVFFVFCFFKELKFHININQRSKVDLGHSPGPGLLFKYIRKLSPG